MESKLSSWPRKHGHLLVFVGAFIVFLTFIVKEGLLERWKDTADTFEAAERFTAQKQMMKSISEDIHALSVKGTPRSVFSAMQFGDEGDDEKRWDEQIDRDIDSDQQHLWNTWSDADNLEPLLKLLPTKDSAHNEREKAEQVYDEANTLIAEFSKQQHTFGAAQHSALRISDHKQFRLAIKELKKKTADDLAPLQDKLADQLTTVESEAYSLQTLTLGHSKEALEKNRHYETYAKWISGFLFALGWGLGLVGKLYGVPEAAGE